MDGDRNSLVLLPSESNDLSAIGLEKASIYPAQR